MIFENPLLHFPPTTKPEVKRNSSTSPFDRDMNRQMTTMSKAFETKESGTKSSGLFDSLKEKFSGPMKLPEYSIARGLGFVPKLFARPHQM